MSKVSKQEPIPDRVYEIADESQYSPTDKRRCLLVLGMHRSGTSALTRIFNLMGAEISQNLMPAKADNVSGFWESESLVQLHEKMLSSAGMHWDDITRFPTGWFHSDIAKQFESKVLAVLKSDFADAPLFTVKDPRICRLVPLWYSVLDAFKTEPLSVLVIRNPLEVAESLRSRNHFSLEKSLMLWLWHVLEAESYSRGKRRSIVDYGRLLTNWPAVMADIQADLHLNLPKVSAGIQTEINRFLSHDLKHHAASLDLLNQRADVVQWVKDVYRILHSAAYGQAIPFDVLDEIRASLAVADSAYGPVISDGFSRIRQLEKSIATMQQEIAGYVAESEETRAEQARRAMAITHLQNEIDNLNAAISYKDKEADNKEEAIAHYRGEIQALHDQIGRLRTEQENYLSARISQLEEKWLQLSAVTEKDRQPVPVRHPIVNAFGSQPSLQGLPKWVGTAVRIHWKIRRLFILEAWLRLAKRRRCAQPANFIRSFGVFDEKYYLDTNPDIAAAGLDPILHYVMYGAAEGRNPSPLFDSRYYLTRNPEVVAMDANPLIHFWTHGAAEGRNPHPGFDVAWYTSAYPEVGEKGMNPLLHFLREGAGKGYRPLPPFSYAEWVRQFDTLSETDRQSVRNRINALSRQPLFSIILMVSGSVTDQTRQSVTALFSQLYSNWELLLATPTADAGEVQAFLQTLPVSDARLKAVLDAPEQKPHPDLNGCVSASAGEYIVVLDDGCRLAEHALFCLADEINRHPNAALIYSDHDHLDHQGRRIDPYFKPDWNADLFYGTDFLDGLKVFNRFFLSRSHGFRGIFKEAQVDDLVLRIAENAPFMGVRHIPHVLFHRAELICSPSPDRCEARREMLLEHFISRRRKVDVVPLNKWYHRIVWPMPDSAPLVSIVIATRDQVELLSACVESLLQKTDYPSYEVLIVDNGSEDPKALAYLDSLKKDARIKVLHYPTLFNYSAIHNWAVKKANGDLLCFLNNDTEIIDSDWLTRMVRHILRKGVGVVGAKLFYPDDTIQHAGVIIGKHGVAGHSLAGLPREGIGYFGRAVLAQELSSVTAACMVTRRDVFEAVSGLDEKNFVIAFNDVDYCLRVRKAGWRVIWASEAQLYHHESVSVGPPNAPDRLEQFGRESRAFIQRWRGVIQNDPFYNPNLSLQNDYELSVPPRMNHCWLGRWAGDDLSDSKRDPRMTLYAGGDNLERSIAVNEPAVFPAQRSYAPGLSIVILNRDQFQLIGPLLDDLSAAKKALAKEGLAIDILVGDTGSQDPRVHDTYEASAGQITVEKNLSYHFSRCNNRMFDRHVRFDLTLFLNNDIIFEDAAVSLKEMLRHLTDKPQVGVLGCRLLYPDGLIQHAGIDFFRDGPLKGLCYHPSHRQSDLREPAEGQGVSVPAVTGACLLTRSALFRAVGGFDEGYRSECQDVALCLALKRLGHRCILSNAGKIVHIENATRQADSEDWQDRSRFVRHWSNFIAVSF